MDRYRNGMLKLSDRNMLLAQQAYTTGQASILGYDTCSDHTESCWQANRIAHFMKITM